MKSDDVVIVSAVRSPIGIYGGQFKEMKAVATWNKKQT